MFQLVVKNTFLEYVSGWREPRCRSAPPKLSAAMPSKLVKKRKRAKKKINHAIDDDDEALQEFRGQVQVERWHHLTRTMLENPQEKRVILSKATFVQLAFCTDMSPVDVLMLRQMGLVQESGELVEMRFSAASLTNPTTALLLTEARRFASLCQSGTFLMQMPDRVAVLVLGFDPSINTTVLKIKGARSCGVPFDSLRLEHLGFELQGSTLGECGLVAGCCVHLRNVSV